MAAASPASRFADPWYFFNSLLVLAHLAAMAIYGRHPDGSDHSRFHTRHAAAAWERQAGTAFVSIMVWQLLKRRSWDHFAQHVFFWGKIVAAATVYQVDARLLVWYALLCFAVMAVCPQPMYQLWTGADSDAVTELTPVSLKEEVQTSHGSDSAWLVFLYTTSHSESTAMAPAFAGLARRYAGSRLRFGAMDALLWPSVTKELKVAPTAFGAQLPTLLLFNKGKEAGRIPRPEDIDDYGLKRNTFTANDVVKRLGLERYAAGAAAAS